MSEHVECSKKASKRKKFLRRALVAASLNSGNAGIRIAVEQTSDGDNQPNERASQSEGVINKGKKSTKQHKRKEKSVVQDTDGIDEVISSNRRVYDTSAEVESNVEESHTERPQSAEPKKKRGPTTMGIIPEGQITRMNVTFNANGQPYGTNSDKFATVLGVLTRTHIPVTHPTWKDLDPTKKDDVWKLTQQYFIVDPVHKGMVYRMLGKYWRQYKCAVTKKILKASRKRHKKRAIDKVKPANVKSQIEWDNFVKYRLGPEFRGPSQQNRNLEQMINAHATTSQSQQSSRPINAPSNDLENRRCALFNWNNYEEDEVVAKGRISSTNPSTKVHCVPLGRDCWKVWVDVVFDKYQTMEVYRATMDAKQLGEAVGSTLAWPKSSIKMLP
ncbi:hypothetical protein ABKV19_003327 [Rosa sericea]